MNLSSYIRLLWKEYRAIRLFWICLVLLIVFIQWLTAALARDLPMTFVPEFSLALAVPVFFMLGCAGTTFAIEKEEGTFDFLQAIPVSSRQLLVSKVLLSIVATLAMYAVLCPLAYMFTHWNLPDYGSLCELLGLWLIGALEALAWGLLFSLLLARPLLAVCLAGAAGSTVAYFLAAWREPHYGFGAAAYLMAAPHRLTVVLLVLIVDVVLGLRWLHGSGTFRRTLETAVDRALGRKATPAISDSATVERLLKSRDRTAILGHLAWQQWRQSGWLMIPLAALSIVVTVGWFIALMVAQSANIIFAEFPIILAAALMGAFVFRFDQEGRRFRFFVEHNVPPRYVWFSRQSLWLFTLCVSTFVIYFVRVGPAVYLMSFMVANWDWYQHNSPLAQRLPIMLANIPLGLACVAVSYAVGQWCSMFIRSGLLAGSVGVVLSIALCGWVALMTALRISWLWSVLPIPLVLLFSTWLRTPDWIRENTTWRARFKAAAVLLAPTLALLIAVPIVRVRQIPISPPGFNVSQYLASITPEALQTAELYRKTVRQFVSSGWMKPNDSLGIYPRVGKPVVTPREKIWLKDNAAQIPTILEISRRESCAFENPSTVTGEDRKPIAVIWLLVLEARQLAAEGKLDESLDDYLAAMRVVSHFAEFSLPIAEYDDVATTNQASAIFRELVYWVAAKGQTAEQIRKAVDKLNAINSEVLHLDDTLKSGYVLLHRQILGDVDALGMRYPNTRFAQRSVFQEILWNKLLPWEKYRGLRELNWMSHIDLSNLRAYEDDLRDGRGVVNVILTPSQYSRLYQNATPFDSWWASFYQVCLDTYAQLARFEAQRRATLIVLALEAYRLEHADLPATLDELEGNYLEKVPSDPYSGQPFAYFPKGIPEPRTPLEKYQFIEGSSKVYRPFPQTVPVTETPCIWWTGTGLIVSQTSYRTRDSGGSTDQETTVTYYTERDSQERQMLPAYTAWAEGSWLPIPEQH